jgi:hypothetical protein
MNNQKAVKLDILPDGRVSLRWLGMGPHDVLPNNPEDDLLVAPDMLPLWAQTSLATLMTLPEPPPSVTINGVGMRVDETGFWLEDKGDWIWR